MTIAHDVKLKIVELRKEGYAYAAIAEMAGVCHASVYDICGKAGLPRSTRGRKSKHSTEEKLKIVELRKEGYTGAAIAKMTGAAMHNIYSYCKNAGLKPKYGHLGRKEQPQRQSGRNETMRQLRSEGFTLEQIGAMYGITRERVRQLCVGIKKPDLRKRVKCCVCELEYVRSERPSKYCSHKCHEVGRIKLFREKNKKFSRHATIELVCTGCGVKFERTNKLESIAECGRMSKGREDSGRRFCSQKCYHKEAFGQSQENNDIKSE